MLYHNHDLVYFICKQTCYDINEYQVDKKHIISILRKKTECPFNIDAKTSKVVLKEKINRVCPEDMRKGIYEIIDLITNKMQKPLDIIVPNKKDKFWISKFRMPLSMQVVNKHNIIPQEVKLISEEEDITFDESKSLNEHKDKINILVQLSKNSDNSEDLIPEDLVLNIEEILKT